MRKKIHAIILSSLFLSFILILSMGAQQTAPSQIRHISPELKQQVDKTDYSSVKIKNIPLAMQCWTFRKFTFFETLEKVKELGIHYIQAYPGQLLDNKTPNARFSHEMTLEQISEVKTKLKETGLTLVAYGVCDIGVTEASMRKVFDFAKAMGIKTIVTEPANDDFTLLEQIIREYNIGIAIHNHPAPSKYNLPETVYVHVKGKEKLIGSCADNGHWMRGMNDPREAFKLLKGRILDVHLKDRSGFGTKDIEDVPWGQGKAMIRDLLAELTLQEYTGCLTIEYENEKEVGNPIPAILKSIEYWKSLVDKK
ncbi:MAG: sugar phosphate isomerase/epimerase [bacterium]